MHPLVVLLSFLGQAPLPVDAAGALSQVMSLAGFAGLLALVINVVKKLGWIKDGQAGFVSAILNLILAGGLLTAQQYLPAFDLAGWNQVAGSVAGAGGILFGLFLQFGSSILAHKTLSTMALPFIGASFTKGTAGKVAQKA